MMIYVYKGSWNTWNMSKIHVKRRAINIPIITRLAAPHAGF